MRCRVGRPPKLAPELPKLTERRPEDRQGSILWVRPRLATAVKKRAQECEIPFVGERLPPQVARHADTVASTPPVRQRPTP